MAVEHPTIRVALDAASDDFQIIDHVIKAMRRSGIPAEEIELLRSGSVGSRQFSGARLNCPAAAHCAFKKVRKAMSRSTKEKRSKFRKLHESGCFVLPNPWDVGNARMLEHLGFEALASTSAGFAWSIGHPDYGLPRSEVLNHLAELSRAVSLPVNADFEAGFAIDPAGVDESVSLAIATGVAGLSIEDRNVGGPGLYDEVIQ